MSLANPLVLVIEDELPMRRYLRSTLQSHGYKVEEAITVEEGREQARRLSPDIVLLDLGLPDGDGLDLARELRAWSQVPIIILSVRSREVEKIEALNAGADDYLTKPFSVGELLARIQVVMRRVGNTGSQPSYQVRDLVVDFDRRQVMLAGNAIDLTPTEFDLLGVLVQNAGKVVTQRQLIHKVWGAAYEDESRLLRVNISNLRKKIEPNPDQPQYILTELGVGYRLKDDFK